MAKLHNDGMRNYRESSYVRQKHKKGYRKSNLTKIKDMNTEIVI